MMVNAPSDVEMKRGCEDPGQPCARADAAERPAHSAAAATTAAAHAKTATFGALQQDEPRSEHRAKISKCTMTRTTFSMQDNDRSA